MYTYIIKSHDLHKIGKAKDVKKRMKEFSTGNPSIELIKTIDGDYESYLHKNYKDKRVVGEWFKLTNEDINNIDKLVENGIRTIDTIKGSNKFVEKVECPCERRYWNTITALMLSGVLPLNRIEKWKTDVYDFEVWHNNEILDSCKSGDKQYIKMNVVPI